MVSDHEPSEETPVPTDTAAQDRALRAAAARLRADREAREAARAPRPLGPSLAKIAARLPEQARDAYARAMDPEQRAAAAIDDAAGRAEAVEALREAQRTHRDAAWQRCVPAKYAAVRLDRLHPQQDRHHRRTDGGGFAPVPGSEGVVSGWLDTRKCTLLLTGPVRRGKTAAAYAVGHAARARGLWVVAHSAPVLMDLAKPSALDNGRAWHHAQECDLLVVDDFGRDRETDWSLERWHVLLDSRLSAERRTVITTNDSQATLRERYGDPILRRITEGSTATVVRIEGDVLGDTEEDLF